LRRARAGFAKPIREARELSHDRRKPNENEAARKRRRATGDQCCAEGELIERNAESDRNHAGCRHHDTQYQQEYRHYATPPPDKQAQQLAPLLWLLNNSGPVLPNSQ
jgi:hypothetical protein